ncbi:MAG: lipid A biosynthesis acyltransferase [Hylemonella sp.]
MLSRLGILFMRLLAPLPLGWLRAAGWLLGLGLYLMVAKRRYVVLTNLGLCFPDLSPAQKGKLARQHFVYFAQAWLDRSWLWHGTAEQARQRLKLSGKIETLQGTDPAVIFAPHFVGLDAGWTALTQQVPRTFTTIYTNQSNRVIDAWVLAGRQRYGRTHLFGRIDGVRSIVAALRAGEPLYLLPDMNFGPHESVFVPFYGVAAATVPSLSRFARLAKAKVVPVVTRMTKQGYSIEVLATWENFPTDDVVADTALMNLRLQDFIDAMPAQYYWVHKRFKDRPAQEPPIY